MTDDPTIIHRILNNELLRRAAKRQAAERNKEER